MVMDAVGPSSGPYMMQDIGSGSESGYQSYTIDEVSNENA